MGPQTRHEQVTDLAPGIEERVTEDQELLLRSFERTLAGDVAVVTRVDEARAQAELTRRRDPHQGEEQESRLCPERLQLRLRCRLKARSAVANAPS